MYYSLSEWLHLTPVEPQLHYPQNRLRLTISLVLHCCLEGKKKDLQHIATAALSAIRFLSIINKKNQFPSAPAHRRHLQTSEHLVANGGEIKRRQGQRNQHLQDFLFIFSPTFFLFFFRNSDTTAGESCVHRM